MATARPRHHLLICLLVAVAVLPAVANFDKGFSAWDRGNYETALKEFRKAANGNDANAQNHLAQMYEDGQGTRVDLAKAVHWYTIAANADHPAAQLNLGRLYRSGKGVQQSDQEAVRWYRAAANQGLAIAQFFMGLMYDTGKGVPSDYVKAYKWFDLAARQGDPDARHKRDRLAQHMTPTQVVEAERQTRIFLGEEVASAPTDNTTTVAGLRPSDERGIPSPPAQAPDGPLGETEIRVIQSLLNTLAYNAGDADGAIGEATRRAATRFRDDLGAAGGGTISRELLARLETTKANLPKLAARPNGGKALVKRIQAALAAHGYEVGAPDGIIGQRTNTAAQEFRRKQGQSGNTLNHALLKALETRLAVRTLRTSTRQVARSTSQSTPKVSLTNSLKAPAITSTTQTSGPIIGPAPAANTSPAGPPVAGETIRRVQAGLAQLGFNPGPADGALGSKTTSAVRAFQAQTGLTPTGKIDTKLLSAVDTQVKAAQLAQQRRFSAPKDEGERVRRIQTALHKLGFDPGPVDGQAGSKTREAVKQYQARARTKPTGELSNAVLQQVESPNAEGIGPRLRFVKPASDREKVRRIQVRLNSLGYGAGAPDGVAGGKTRTAAKQFQRSASLRPVDGKLSVELLRTLEATQAPRAQKTKSVASHGDLVRDIQRQLNRLGYPAGDADGIIGQRTVEAARTFQRDEGLPTTGKLTPGLLRSLKGGQQ
ncbi:MAG: hypothetical protein HOI95_29625 [Chromatiales bacterium]|jgi:peptidoglycan hydrolase-like protein with peptidoglycan-binding domain|nr:hypothetical protein [Chromatiales bacterium]